MDLTLRNLQLLMYHKTKSNYKLVQFSNLSIGGRLWISMCSSQMLIIKYFCTDCISPNLLKNLY